MLEDDRANGRPPVARCQADRHQDGPRGMNAVRLHALVLIYRYYKPEAWHLINMPREVCLKHRKIRREIHQRVRVLQPDWQWCLFSLVQKTRCGHRSRAGFRDANPAMPVRFRLAAFHFPNNTRRAPAALRGLQNHACPGRHRDVVPFISKTAE